MAGQMSETTIDNQPDAGRQEEETLAGAVDALVDEIDGFCEAFERDRAEAPPPEARQQEHAPATPAPPDAPDAGLDEQVDELAASMDEPVEDEPADPDDAPEAAEPESAPPPEAPDASPTPEEPPAPEPQSIDELDEALAHAADEELDGDIHAPEEAPPAPTPAAVIEPQTSQQPEPAPPPAQQASPAPEPEPEPAQDAAAPTLPPSPWRRWGAAILRLLALPLSRLTPTQRDTIGWVAMYTLFLAMCVWVYALLR